MSLSDENIKSLLDMIAAAQPDGLDCDGCFEHLAEFADAKLAGRGVPDALKAVETHLQQCACCMDEFKALMEGLRELEQIERDSEE